MREPRRTVEGTARALQPPLPAVRAGERVGARGVLRGELLERPPRVVVEERRARASAGQGALLQPEDEDGVEAPRSGAPEVDDGNPARVVACTRRERCTLDRCDHVLAAQVAAEVAPVLEL